MTTAAEHCPTCHGRVARPRYKFDPNAIIDPPADMVRYLAVWAFHRTVADLPEMCDQVNHIIKTEGVILAPDPADDPRTCPECGGHGWADEQKTRRCPTCHGDGLVENWETNE